jgi:hypothetical protein
LAKAQAQLMAGNNKKIIIIILLILTVGMGGFLFFRSPDESGAFYPEDATTQHTLAARTQSEVAQITLVRGEERLTFLPGMQVTDLFLWYIEGAADWVLEPLRVQELLFAAFNLSAMLLHEDTRDMDLAQFGFDAPAATFIIEYTTGETLALHLGDPTPDRRHFFLIVENNNAMFLVPYITGARMLMDTGEIISRFVPDMRAEDILKLRISQRGREPFYLNEALEIKSPAALYGLNVQAFYLNRFLLDNVNTAMQLNAVAELYANDLAQFGLDEPFLELYYLTPNQRIHMIFGDAFMLDIDGTSTPHIYAAFVGRPHVFIAPLSAVNYLTDINPMQFMMRFIAPIPLLEVSQITIRIHAEYDEFYILNVGYNDGADIVPSINNNYIAPADFRALYRMLVALSADAAITPIAPAATPEITINYYLLDGTQMTIEFFNYNYNFYSFSVNGEYKWAVTNRHALELLLAEIRE